MESLSSCPTCGCNFRRERICDYVSHVKLFHIEGHEDRGVWTLGADYILKERPMTPYDNPNSETLCLDFPQRNTTIPIPGVIKDWSDDNGSYFKLQTHITGETLEDAWSSLSTADKSKIANETVQHLLQLRKFHSLQTEAFGGYPMMSNYLFHRPGDRFGPFGSDYELFESLTQDIQLPGRAGLALRKHLPKCTPYTLTHGDLNIANIIVRSGRLAGIIDWETAGYYPVWWEWVRAGVCHGPEDTEWKGMLQQRMEQFPGAAGFWRDLGALSASNEKGWAVLKALMEE